MPQFFNIVNYKLIPSKENSIEKSEWIHFSEPSAQEIKKLIEALKIPKDFFKSALDIHENARIEKENNRILIVLRTPYAIRKSKLEIIYQTLPFGIILTEDKVLTISSKRNKFIESIFIEKAINIQIYNHSNLILYIMFYIADLYLNFLNEIIYLIEENETILQESMKNEQLFELLKLQKSLVYFTTSLKTNYVVVEKFRKELISEKDYILLKNLIDDTIIEYRQAIEMTTTTSKILFNTMTTFASIISNNLNSIMKLLTSIAIVLTLPVIVSSIYGMNIALPFQNHPYAFWLIILISIISSIIAIIFFTKKKWF